MKLRRWLRKRTGLLFMAGHGALRREGSPWFSIYLGPRHVSFPPGRKRPCTTQVGFSGIRPGGGSWYAIVARRPQRLARG